MRSFTEFQSENSEFKFFQFPVSSMMSFDKFFCSSETSPSFEIGPGVILLRVPPIGS